MPRIIALMFTIWLVKNHMPDIQTMFQHSYSTAQEAPGFLRRKLNALSQPLTAPALTNNGSSAAPQAPDPASRTLTDFRPRLAYPSPTDNSSATEIQLAARSYRAQLAELSLAP
jgi:hypothetical protein